MKAQIVNRSTAKEFILFPILLLAAMLLWHGGVIVGSQVLCGGDQVNHIIPLRMIQEKWGWFTAWDPYTFGGRPLLDDIQVGAYYPLNWLHWLGASIERTMSLLAMLHLTVGAFGFFVFLRERHGFSAACLAALVWTFGAFQVLKVTAGIYVFTNALAWMPWMWWAAEHQSLHRGRGMAFCGALALFGGMQLLGGAPQIVQITWCGLALWTLGRMIRPRDGEGRFIIVAGFISAGVLSLLIASPMLLGALHLQLQSYPRTSGDLFTYLSDGSISFRLLWTWLFPEIFGPGNSEDYYWGSSVGYHETAIYAGIIPVMLAVFAAVSGLVRRGSPEERRWIVIPLGLAVLSVLIALGSNGFLFELLVNFVPSFRFFRVPARWALWLVAVIAVLSARGMEELAATHDDVGRRRAQTIWLGVAGVFIVVCAIVRVAAPSLIQSLGINDALQRVPPLDVTAHRDKLMAFATASITWALMMSGVGCVVGVFMLRGTRRRGLAAAVLLCCTFDLYRFWLPYTDVIPDDVTPPRIETETPYHLISAKHFRDYFYPETELMKALKAEAENGRIHYDDMIPAYMNDQNQRELLNQRPIAHGLYVTRGYQQLHLRGYVEDYYSSIIAPFDGRVGAFLNATEVRDRRFFDAYNVTRVLTYPYPELERNYEKIGLVKEGPLGPYGLVSWRNPHARGWVWLSGEKAMLNAEPDASLGTVDLVERTPDKWVVKISARGPCHVHFSEAGYDWAVAGADGAGREIHQDSDGTVQLPSAGVWRMERTAPASPVERALGAGFALLLSALLVTMGIWRSRSGGRVSIQPTEGVSL
ncbi:hypothetical protein IT570_01490 [Candidatus Sumerlaeota bacterium]|nr:hypothetical protein [Candidatus Sumerlaeota bacterium]